MGDSTPSIMGAGNSKRARQSPSEVAPGASKKRMVANAPSGEKTYVNVAVVSEGPTSLPSPAGQAQRQKRDSRVSQEPKGAQVVGPQ